jgi:hypothetical protein
MVALLKTKPATLDGAAAVPRYIGENGVGDHDFALFGTWSEPWKSAGAAFRR